MESSSRISSAPPTVDLLLGIHEAGLFSTNVLQTKENLLLCQSLFGSGILLIGHHPHLNPRVVLQAQHMLEKARTLYGKQVNHVLTRHKNSYPAFSNRTSAGGGGLQGDCQQVLFAPGSLTLPLEGGEGRDLGGDVEEILDTKNSLNQAIVSHLARSFSFLECEEMGTRQPRRCQSCSAICMHKIFGQVRDDQERAGRAHTH